MLAEKLFNLQSFKRQYSAVLTLSVCRTIKDLNWKKNECDLLSEIDWNNVIGIASALSHSEVSVHLDAALRIAQTALALEFTSRAQKDSAAVVLKALTNKPAIGLAINRGYLSSDYDEDLPFSVKLHGLRMDLESSVIINDQMLYLNRFQKKVYDSYLENDAVSISAPTSSGKSFVLCNIVLEEIIKRKSVVIYIVPTRALISQVENDIAELIRSNSLKKVSISTVPLFLEELEECNVFIFTQERLHWFLMENSGVKIDTIVVDEAQKIEDGYRGMLLQQKLEEVLASQDGIKVYFSSPFTSNPEVLLEGMSPHVQKSSVNTQFISVNQNLLYVTQVPGNTKLWSISLCLPETVIVLGTVDLVDRPTTEKKKVVFLLNAIAGSDSGNIIYCNGAAEAENTALLLNNFLPEAPENTEINSLIQLVKKTIHPNYALATVLEKRVAFHYGNMPLLIRQEIERLFKSGVLRHLLCTSTLLEGVNLPAETIFIRKPKRGNNNPLNQSDFWNLAGRAGRWGKEFSGNIICISPQTWDIPPNPVKHKQKIVRAIDEIERKGDDLINYIEAGDSRKSAEESPDLEFAFGYYYNRYIDGTLDEKNHFQERLTAVLSGIRALISVPEYILKRNPGISPIAQQGLLDYFESYEKNIAELLPAYPEDENAFVEYTKLVGRIGKTISTYPPQLNQSRAVLLINWMSGKPLSYIIKSSHASYRKKGNEKKTLSVVIRDVMWDVENFARFRFARDSSCYVDVLRYFLEVRGRDDLLKRIPDLKLWLEFGVSQKTHLSLLSLGLSRSSVIELTEYVTNSEMSKVECFEWMKSLNLDQLDLSVIIREDIKAKLLDSSS